MISQPRPPHAGLRPAVFLDKDGTLIDDVPYNVDPARIRLTRGARDGVHALRDAGYALVVASNQSGVARGLFTQRDLAGVRLRIEELLGLRFDGFYCCPHLPAGAVAEYAIACGCRKPEPGLLTRAAHELGLDLARSWMVGDILGDIEAGRRAGCRTVLLHPDGDLRHLSREHDCVPTLISPDLADAARRILAAARPAEKSAAHASPPPPRP
jgi:D-glycero-D-manno-heptose 1,7-bisphosphate phosphatase